MTVRSNLPLFPGYNRIRHLLVTDVPLGLGISDGEEAMRVLLHKAMTLNVKSMKGQSLLITSKVPTTASSNQAAVVLSFNWQIL